MRESSNNFSPSQTGEFCLDRIQRMTVFVSSDMSSALAQESSSSRQGIAFPYFHCKKRMGYGMVVGQFRMWEIQVFLTGVSHSPLKIIPNCLRGSMLLLLICL